MKQLKLFDFDGSLVTLKNDDGSYRLFEVIPRKMFSVENLTYKPAIEHCSSKSLNIDKLVVLVCAGKQVVRVVDVATCTPDNVLGDV